MNHRSRLAIAVCHWLCQCVLLVSSAQADDPGRDYRLEEPVTDRRPFNVSIRMTVAGEVEFALGDGKSAKQPLEVEATVGYRERRLSGTGRDAQALRSLREYDKPQARIKIGERLNFNRLRSDRRTVVAQGRREGVLLYSPAGPMNALELELLEHPGDSLAALGLLPPRAVSAGEKWAPESWVIACLTRTEAVVRSELTCRLESVTDGSARVAFAGEIEGAILGAATEIEVDGTYHYDLQKKCLTRLELTQTERRSVGTVSPGISVTARIALDRAPTPVLGRLTDALADSIPLEPDDGLLSLHLDLPGEMRITCDRTWKLFHQTEQVTVLRMLERGSLVCQCNISRIPAVAPGRHTPVDRFEGDIRIALGDKLREFEQAGEIPAEGGRFLYRAMAVGESNGEPMHWIYYLCAAPDGRQVSFVFTLESDLLEQLAERDVELVRSLQFLAPPRPVERRAAGRSQ